MPTRYPYPASYLASQPGLRTRRHVLLLLLFSRQNPGETGQRTAGESSLFEIFIRQRIGIWKGELFEAYSLSQMKKMLALETLNVSILLSTKKVFFQFLPRKNISVSYDFSN